MRKKDVLLTNAIAQPNGLRIYLLGPLRIEREQETIRLSRRKVEALLAYLLLHPERQTRDHLATLFWGDSSDSQARHSLRTALAALRKEVDADLLLVDRDHVQLNPDCTVWTDLDELLAIEDELEKLNPAALPARLTLWQGELLAGFYEEWLTSEREHYRTRLLTLFLQATQALRSQSDYATAITVAQQILTIDPANEQAHQHLMFCYLATGDRPAALRQYEQCERALLEDLDAPPMPETTALYHWIKQQAGTETTTAAKITNLPIPLTSFVGRTEETAAVKHLLNPLAGKTRLLTLTGAGGSGKTRLAIQAATDLIDRFAHGVWWVELATLTAGDQVARAIAKALGIAERANEAILQSVINFLADKPLLLIIDNCEHLVEATAQLVDELLSRCPHLQIMTTSREALNVGGETLWPVPTLTLPDPQAIQLTDLLLQFACVRLFYERACTVQPAFQLTLANAPAVAAICTQLDGIPLAIELAAARVKVLPVEQIARRLTERLGARFDLLTQGSRTAQPRQQTLRAAIDWSYDLLDEAERQLFQIVAVFRGGFTLDALEQILACRFWLVDFAGKEVPSASQNLQAKIPNPLDLLTQLVDKSLVIVEPRAGDNRYRLLETLREYALEQFPTAVERQLVQQSHAAYFLQMAEEAEQGLNSAQQQIWLNWLELEHPNLRAALDHLLAASNHEQAWRLASAIHRFWDIRGYVGEGRTWLARTLAQRQPYAPALQAKALSAAGFLAVRQSDYDHARPLLEEALALFDQSEQKAGWPEAMQNLAIVAMSLGDYGLAEKQLTESLERCRTLGYTYGIARTLNILGNLAWDQERLTVAYEYYQESLRLFQGIGDQVSMATGFLNMGSIELQRGNIAVARTNFEACLAHSRTLNNKWLTGVALKCLGWAAFDQQEYELARRYGEEALHFFHDIDDKVNIGQALSALGEAEWKLGAYSKALAYYCQNLQVMHNLGHQRGASFALNDMARLLTDVQQHLEKAVVLFAVAATIRQENGIAAPTAESPTLEQRLANLRSQLGDALFDTLWQAGQTTPLVQIVAETQQLQLLTDREKPP
jgi:predicted ATPase/DNA-binding SARP family transcriptional activator